MNRWLPLAVFACLTLTVSGEARPRARPPEPPTAVDPTGWKPDQRLRNWLGREDEFTVEHLRTLVELARKDPTASAIVDQAMARARATTVEEFFPLFRTSDPTPSLTRSSVTAGELNHGDYEVEDLKLETRDLVPEEGDDPALREPYRSRIEEIRNKPGVYVASVERRSHVLRVHRFSNASIFLKRDESLQQSLENFVHELTHFVRFDLLAEPDPTAFDTQAAYDTAYQVAPGQETDARVEGFQAICRLIRGLPYYSSLPIQHEAWFSAEDCSLLKPREEFEHVLGFLGYSNAGTWRNRLEVGKDIDAWERDMLRYLLRARLAELNPGQVARARAKITALEARIERATQLLAR